MKAFFILTLVLSVLSPAYQLIDCMGVMAHNHYGQRHAFLDTTIKQPEHVSISLGLTPTELAKCDEYVAHAYEAAVYDGSRLGIGYGRLGLQSLILAALLFFTSLVGLRSLRRKPN